MQDNTNLPLKSRMWGKFLDIIGIDGSLKNAVKPMFGFNSANISIGGSGYPISLYYLQFLTFVEGLTTTQAGMVMMIGGIFEAIANPVMGIITDRTRSKYGKHRFYFLIGIIPIALTYFLLWTSLGISSGGSQMRIMVYYSAAYVLFNLAYTMVSVPHTAMLPRVAPTYFLRTQYKLTEYIMNSAGQFPAFLLMAIVLGGFTDLPDPSPADRGKYTVLGIVLAVYYAWPLLCCFKCTKEESSEDEREPKLGFKELVNEYRLVFKNKAFRQHFYINALFRMSMSFYKNTDQYFMVSIADKYKYFNLLNTISGAAEASGSPINYLLVRYKGKQFCGKLLGPLMLVGIGMNYFISASTPAWVIFVAAILYNFGYSGPGFVETNIQPDVTDVDELITGRRREGIISTFTTFIRKAINSFMAAFVGKLLEVFGYNTQVKNPALQSARTIFGLKLNFVIIPFVLGLLCILSIFSYSMTKDDHEMMTAAIEEKKKTGSVSLSPKQIERLEKISGVKFCDTWLGKPDTMAALDELNV